MKTIVLESAKVVKGGKVQLAFSQVIDLGGNGANPLALLNASDERFAQAKPRYVWVTSAPVDVQKQFGIDVSTLAEGQELEINMVDPRLTALPDTQLNIQIEETVEGTEYQVANFEKTAKRAGKDGDFIMSNGMYIYVNTRLVAGTPKHKLVSDTTRVAVGNNAIAEALGE
jgi:hypothetical protein